MSRFLWVLVAGSALGCSPSCPQSTEPSAALDEPLPNAECAERLAAKVCDWGPDEHAERRRRRQEREAEQRRDDAGHPGRVSLRHSYEVQCGCVYEPLGDCFLSTTRYEGGHRHVIATGAPGCARGTSAFHAAFAEQGADPGRCGSTVELGPRR